MQLFNQKCLLVFLLLWSFGSSAQDTATYVLKDIEIVGIDLSRFSAGTVVNRMGKTPGGVLANLGDQCPVYFKNYGSQQLSTISLRGTSASHTNVIWNGLPVNSPTLGQTDFSIWPMFLTDQLILQYGGGSSLFGSGAIGGTVIVDNSTPKTDSLITLYLGYGSFGERNGGIRLIHEQGSLINSFSAYGSMLENNFPREDGIRQDHASVDRLGFTNKLNYKYSDKGRIFSEVAYVENDREIQPTKTSTSRNTLKSKNFRGVVNHELKSQAIHRSILGFISDETVYNDSIVTTSYRMIASHALEEKVGEQLFTRFGGMGIYEWARSENFKGLKDRIQGHLFASATLVNAVGSMTLNARNANYQNEHVFVPSLGVESKEMGRKVSVSLRGQISRDYRIPTFNDLYWMPGGNPNLQAERSINYEVGADIEMSFLHFSTTFFNSSISDWIQWQPRDGVWTPENLRSVQSRGVEVNLSAELWFKDLLLSFVSSYTYVHSTDKELGYPNQLPYVPRHSAVSVAKLSSGNAQLRISGNYTGKRFTTLTNSRSGTIDSFFLIDMSLSNDFMARKLWMNIGLTIKNVANTEYENLKNTAMPGRAFLIEITTKI